MCGATTLASLITIQIKKGLPATSVGLNMVLVERRLTRTPAELAGPYPLPTYETGLEESIIMWAKLDKMYNLRSWPVVNLFTIDYVQPNLQSNYLTQYQSPEDVT